MSGHRYFIVFFIVIKSSFSFALDADDKLGLIINLYGLNSLACDPPIHLKTSPLVDVGAIAFESTIISGDNEISCASCHLDDQHLADGLPVAVGVGRDQNKEISNKSVIVPRNAFTLFSRSHSDFTTFFWDGKVLDDGKVIYSPIGDGRVMGFDSALAIAAILPILARDEFLGKSTYFGSSQNYDEIDPKFYLDRFNAANSVLAEVFERHSSDADDLRSAFLKAGIDSPTLVDVGNALAAFIGNKTSKCDLSSWEQYLSGNRNSLSDKQKRGAVLFYGQGRCAACHSGALFSDMKFHSLGIPQGDAGPYMHSQDLGRAMVTYRLEDRYKFRTPPLIGVSATAPYGHNGAFEDMASIVMYHLNPIPFLKDYRWSSQREELAFGKLLSSRSSKLSFINIETDEELSELVEFLKAL